MKLLRHVYTNNPFYLISALLVLFGLYRLFPAEDSEDAWLLLGSICVYATLLAVTAVLIIRFGKVWEDARSILLVIILMFLALAASFDEMLLAQPGPGCVLLIGGLVFSVLVSEALLRSLRMRLPALFRASYYLLLGGFFLYPLVLAGLVFFARPEAVGWGALLFTAVMGIASLSLIPAIRRGSAYVRASGTPWSWPWYPWTLFGVLALGVCGRAYFLTLTFGIGPGNDSAFPAAPLELAR